MTVRNGSGTDGPQPGVPAETRFDRHQLIDWWDQGKLSETNALVVGAGALGNEVIKLLALIGVGRVTVIDFDTISRSNLSRTVLFRESDVGKPKASVAAERALLINPGMSVTPIIGDIEFDLGLGDLRHFDVVFGCLDSVHARFVLNRRCILAGVGWINGGISDYHGQVTRYEPRSGSCYECTFTPATLRRLRTRYSCGLRVHPTTEAVPTTAVTASVVGALQVQEALQMLHGLADTCLAPGTRLTVNLRPYRMFTDVLERSDECLAHDPGIVESTKIVTVPGVYGAISVGQVIETAIEVDPDVDTMQLGFDLVTSVICRSCGMWEELNRPKTRTFLSEMTCPTCGQARQYLEVGSVRSGSQLETLRVSDLGLPPREIVLVTGGRGQRIAVELPGT